MPTSRGPYEWRYTCVIYFIDAKASATLTALKDDTENLASQIISLGAIAPESNLVQ